MNSDVDVAVIGGGAAGIAAARTLHQPGRSVLLIEASERLGGRARTVTVDGHALDLGCGWLHSAGRNPLVAMARVHGIKADRTPAAWGAQWRDLGFPRAARWQAHAARARFEERLRHAPPASDRAGDAVAADDRWRPYLDAMSGYVNGVELDRLSAADFLTYDNAATQDDWRLPGGYGAFVGGLGDTLPIALGTTVIAIDHGGTSITIETDRGTIRAGAAIVAIPTDILARGAIRFTPAVDPHLHAAACLPLGLADKLFLMLADPAAVSIESHLLGDPRNASTGSYYLRPLGLPLIECFFGGIGARALDEQGDDASVAFAREELGHLLGNDFARGLMPMARSAWRREPTIGGSYSHALPGEAHQRAVLASPPSPRLAFAGEACSPRDFSTCHGAWESGMAAAMSIVASISR